MKKLILLLVLIVSTCTCAMADKSGVYLDFYKTGHGNKSTTVHRSPMRLPIEVCYDDCLNEIEVIGNLVAEVYLYDSEQNLIGFSESANDIFPLPMDYRGRITIHIEGSDWTAEGFVEI